MKQFPPIPRAEDAPEELFQRGHLWLLEKIDGAHLRFQLQASGQLRFGDRDRVYQDPTEVPEPYQHAVRHVQETLDREALRAAVDNVEDVVFFGEATCRQTIDYDWEQTPAVLGFDIWSAADEKFRPPGAANRIFERLGLQPVNAVERELSARDFDPDAYSIPESAWYDGPAEGVVIRNKRGQRAKLLNPKFEAVEEHVSLDTSAEKLAEQFATERRFEKLLGRLQDRSQPVTFDRLYQEALQEIYRENPRELFEETDMRTFRSELSARTQAFLDEYWT